MSGNGLKFGLSLSSKAKKPTAPPKPKKPVFGFAPGDDADEGEEHEEEGGSVFGKAKKNRKDEKKGVTKKIAAGREKLVVNAQLSTFNELSRKAEAAVREVEIQVDPSVYDYDGVWDDMKSVDRKKQKAEEADALGRKPKYMENLLQAAEIRKRDQLRAKERLLQKEREAEGEEYADKESFVTGAYKKQQEEMRKLEEEERLREEGMRQKSQGMSTFYRNMLDKTESKHEEIVAAATSNKDTNPELEDRSTPRGKSDVEIAAELKAKGASVEINEEGQVIDKTQLLSGGLNLGTVRSSKASTRVSHSTGTRQQPGYQSKNKLQQDLRARQSKMLEDQLAQAQKRALEEEEESRAELERQTKSRKTSTDVQSAKERYLQRKREAAAKK
ncbi:putative nuclear speckle splicing regulatory protein 1 like protein [Tuber indicum]|nr:putative nuclear speckle splicing regulatory protein 1 like protein [Tuber indicum]